ncbi:DUF6602 domain-containing protein [Kosakonia quasisacchari]|uniref:DUF6602 domain-containing protein n=1 Tax=Kosakonia quasisacchari TaxID=2529380 RepID=UPI0039DFDE5A
MPSKFLTNILENKILSALQTSSVIGEIAHPVVKGSLRESFIAEILKSILPHHFGVGSGIIIDKWDKSSPQADIIIYDKRQIPPVIDSETNGVFPIDSVHRVIEIKSNLTSTDVNQVLNMAWALHPDNTQGLKIAVPGKLENGYATYPLVSCFAYQSSIASLPSIADEWIDKIKITNLGNVMFCIPKRGLYTNPSNEGYQLGLPGSIKDSELIRHYLSMFLHFIEDSADSRKQCSILDWLM